MGYHADDIIEGACCALCGVYFEEEHGYPVACSSCYTKDCGYDKATEKVLYATPLPTEFPKQRKPPNPS